MCCAPLCVATFFNHFGVRGLGFPDDLTKCVWLVCVTNLTAYWEGVREMWWNWFTFNAVHIGSSNGKVEASTHTTLGLTHWSMYRTVLHRLPDDEAETSKVTFSIASGPFHWPTY